MFQPTLLRDEQVERLAGGVCRVLERVGILCQNEELLQALAAAGAQVDVQLERARFPRRLIASLAESLRQENADLSRTVRPFTPPGQPTIDCQIAQFYYDHPRRERRIGNRRDLIEMIRLADVLHPEVPAGHVVVQAEVPRMLEALESALLLAEYAHEPGRAFAWYAEQIDWLVEMGEILGIPDWFNWGAICFAHPFRFDKDVADKFVRRVREGVPTGLTAMPVAGVTAPVTMDGFVVVAAAEQVATWLAARALNGQVALSGAMWAGAVDMKSGSVSYSAPDAMIRGFATVEFLRRWTGIDVPVGGGEYCDARAPGMAAAWEKAYKAMTIAAFTGRHPEIGEGMLENGKVFAPVQLLLERDLSAGVAHLARQLSAREEEMLLDEIEQVDLGFSTNHMLTAGTLAHYRSSLWLPGLIERAGWAGAAGDAALLDKAQGRIDELLGQYHKPEGREKQLAAMRQVVERARKRFYG
jgi:trimethylamine--corrinoid protein Co-methyltransferase